MYCRNHAIKLVIIVYHIIRFHILQGKSEPQPFLPFVFQNLVEQLIKNALALVGGVGHMLHNEEQVIAVFSVCTRITAVTES